MPINPRREFTCLTVALTAFASPLLPTLRPHLHEVRAAGTAACSKTRPPCHPTSLVAPATAHEPRARLHAGSPQPDRTMLMRGLATLGSSMPQQMTRCIV